VTLVYVLACNALLFVYMVAVAFRNGWRETRFEAIRKAAVLCAREGWVPVRVTWHGLFRTEARMDIRHPDGQTFTLRAPR
jgi:hypothetical protein